MERADARKFFKRLGKDASRKVFLILDNLKMHHAQEVKECLSEHRETIEVFYIRCRTVRN